MVNRSVTRWRTGVLAAIVVISFTAAGLTANTEHRGDTPRDPAPRSGPSPVAVRADARERYVGTPLRFERAGHATGPEFVARGLGYVVGLSNAGATVALRKDPDQPAAVVTMRVVGGASDAVGSTRQPLSGVTNYVIGRDSGRWRMGVAAYGEVEYRNVYPGVDVVYYGNQQQLEYDFIVAPGASHRSIALAFDGASGWHIDAAGNLIVSTPAGDLVQRTPRIYQETPSGRREIAGVYIRRDKNQVGFRIGEYDRRLPLVIDPVLSYASYLGGAKEERAGGVAVDAQGNIYIAGMTGSADFPVAAPTNLLHGRNNGDVFVVKLNPAGDQIIYATYLGGTDYEEPAALRVDAAGNAYVTGTTYSSDFPTVNAIQSSRDGVTDAFVAKLDVTGAVAYSTYLGGTQDETGTGLAVDASGRAYVTGGTWSANFPTVNPFQPSLAGSPALRSIDGGLTWGGLSQGLQVTGVTAFALDPQDPSTVFAGTMADGILKSTDGGASWTPTGDLPVAVKAIVIDALGTIYAGTEIGVFTSHDAGASWAYPTLWAPISSLAIDRTTSTVYAGGAPYSWQPGVFATTDGGNSWMDLALPGGVTSVAVSQSVVYAGTDSAVFKMVPGGAWAMLPGIQEMVTTIAVNPYDANEVWVGTYSVVFHTMSGGLDWQPVWEVGPGALSIVVAPSNPATVYFATWSGIVATDDGGGSWRWPSSPMTVNTLAIDPLVATTVYAGTSVASDVFVARFSADGSSLEYSTYMGGTDFEWDSDIAVDTTGAAYVVGTTKSTDFPVLQPFQPMFGGTMDVFAAKLSETGTPIYATYLGGFASDYSARLAVDDAGQAHVVGVTLSGDFPVALAYQPLPGGGYSDVFVSTLNATGDDLVFSTYLGGAAEEEDSTGSLSPAPGITVGAAGETVVTGTTRSTNFPTRQAVQANFGGGTTDAFVTSFDAAGQLQFSTYLGGTGDDFGRRVGIDQTGAAVVVGATTSTNFPTRQSLQQVNAGGIDVFVARIGEADEMPPAIVVDSPAATDYLHTDSIQLSFTATDSGSGLAEGSPAATLDGVVVHHGDTVQLLSLALGTHALRVTARDTGGNVATQDVAFHVTASLDSLIAVVNICTAQGQIAANLSKQLLAKLKDAQTALASGDVSAAGRELGVFKARVIARLGSDITPSCAQLLSGDADYVLGTL